MKRTAGEALRALPEGSRELVKAVLHASDEARLAVYLVGGPVRDWLLGRRIRDVDLLIEADPSQTQKLLDEKLPGETRVTAHERFGTFSVTTPTADLDLSTARREQYAHDGALPTVEPGSLLEDLARRDFGCNALALPLSREARAKHRGVVAPEGALADLAARRLRVLHAASFRDDPTRVLRAARLAPRLGFSLARDSRGALRDALRSGAFGRVSGDRLRREWVKLFDDAGIQGADPVRSLRLLSDWHVLGALEPGLELVKDVVVPLRRLGRFLVAPPFRTGRFQPWRVGIALWLAPLRPGLRRRSLRRFGVRGAIAERIAGWDRTRDKSLRRLGAARGRGAVDAALSELSEEEIVGLHIMAPPALRRRIARFADEDRHRKLPIQGDDLLALGLSGPALGRVQERIRAAMLDGQIRTREEALVLATEVSRRRR